MRFSWGSMLVSLAAGIYLAGAMFHFGTPAQAQPGNIPSRVASISDITLGAAATQIVPANASRRTLSCTNNDAANGVRWGDSSITTTKGQRIAAGSTISIAATAAIFMIAEAGTPIVSCTQDTL